MIQVTVLGAHNGRLPARIGVTPQAFHQTQPSSPNGSTGVAASLGTAAHAGSGAAAAAPLNVNVSCGNGAPSFYVCSVTHNGTSPARIRWRQNGTLLPEWDDARVMALHARTVTSSTSG